MARKNRVKVEESTWYHLISRITNREFLLGNADVKSHFVGLFYRTMDFSGVELGTYAIMDNHVHLLVRVPERVEINDAEIIRRISVLNGPERADAVEAQWRAWIGSGKEELYERDRRRYLRRMYDVSQFMKTLKELFTMWYNRKYSHIGALWTGRFKSLMMEGGRETETIRAYVERNPVRARIVPNPSDYAWSGVGAALRGDKVAQRGQALLNGEVASAGNSQNCNYAAEDGRKVDAGATKTVNRDGGSSATKVCNEGAGDADGGSPAGRSNESRQYWTGRRVIAFSNGLILGSCQYVNRMVRRMGFFSKRTRAWALSKKDSQKEVFAALGYKEDSIAKINEGAQKVA